MKTKLLYGLMVMMLIIGIAAFAYLNDYYHADMEAIAAVAVDESIAASELSDGIMLIAPKEADTAFIFYPGGKVECSAYLPLMCACAEEGIACVLLEVPFNLAVLDIYAADGIQEILPEIKNWPLTGRLHGGNHADFGAYGPQEGDGEANITNEEQIALTAKLVAAFVK